MKCLHGTRAAAAILLAAAVTSDAVIAQQSDHSEPSTGQVIRLPGAGAADDALDVSATVTLLGRSIDETINHIQDGDLKAFVRSYRGAVQVYSRLADQVGDASESLGAVQAGLTLLESGLDDLEEPVFDVSEREQIVAALESVDRDLFAELTTLHERFQHMEATAADQPQAIDPEERKQIISRMYAVTQRLEVYRQLSRTLADGDAPMAPGSATLELRRQFDEAQKAVASEIQALQLTADTVRTLMSSYSVQMARSLRVIELHAQIPFEEMARIRQLREQLPVALDELATAHRQARFAVLGILAGEIEEEVIDEESALERINAMLNSRR